MKGCGRGMKRADRRANWFFTFNSSGILILFPIEDLGSIISSSMQKKKGGKGEQRGTVIYPVVCWSEPVIMFVGEILQAFKEAGGGLQSSCDTQQH